MAWVEARERSHSKGDSCYSFVILAQALYSRSIGCEAAVEGLIVRRICGRDRRRRRRGCIVAQPGQPLSAFAMQEREGRFILLEIYEVVSP